MEPKHLISLHFDEENGLFKHWSDADIKEILEFAAFIKQNSKSIEMKLQMMTFFFNPSTRTSSSLRIGIQQLGGNVKNANFHGMHNLYDKYETIASYYDLLAIRRLSGGEYKYGEVEKKYFADLIEKNKKTEQIPIISLKHDKGHPLQGLYELMTYLENFNGISEGYVNFDVLKRKKILVSWGMGDSCVKEWAPTLDTLLIATRYGMDVTLCHPEGYELDDDVMKKCKEYSNANTEGSFNIVHDFENSFSDQEIVYVRNWISKENNEKYPWTTFMPNKTEAGLLDTYEESNKLKGLQKEIQEKEKKKAQEFSNWKCTKELLKKTNNAKFINPMPPDEGCEMDNEVWNDKELCLTNELKENKKNVQNAVFLTFSGNFNPLEKLPSDFKNFMRNFIFDSGCQDLKIVPEDFGEDGKDSYTQTKGITIDPFYISKYCVTNENYFQFVCSNSEWRKERIRNIGEENFYYLEKWTVKRNMPNKADLIYGPRQNDLKKPVVWVPYAAAEAFAKWIEKKYNISNMTIPSNFEWYLAALSLDNKDKYNTESRVKKSYPWSSSNPQEDKYKYKFEKMIKCTDLKSIKDLDQQTKSGLCSLIGQCSNWCRDWHSSTSEILIASDNKENEKIVNYDGPHIGLTKIKRGISYVCNDKKNWRNIDSISPFATNPDTGIRLVMRIPFSEKKYKLLIRDAAVAIMTKNFSPCLGSHALPNWIRLIRHKNREYISNLNAEKEDTRKETAQMINHLIERAELLAEFAFGINVVWSNQYSVKEIIDSIEDLKFLFEELLTKSEGFIKNGKSSIRFEYQTNGDTLKLSAINSGKIEFPAISFPHDRMGMQTLIIILENIIRNAVKHNEYEENSILKIILNFIEDKDDRDSEDILKLEIHECYSKPQKEQEIKMKNNLFEPLIDPMTEDINKQYYGLKEIRICAGYLSKLSSVNNEKISLRNFIEKKEDDDIFSVNFKPNLFYKLNLLRHKEVFVYSEDKPENTKNWEKKGIYFFSDKNILTEKLTNFSQPNFLVYTEKMGSKELEIKPSLRPMRYFKIDEMDKKMAIGQFLNQIHEKWMDKINTDHNSYRIIDLNNMSNDEKEYVRDDNNKAILLDGHNRYLENNSNELLEGNIFGNRNNKIYLPEDSEVNNSITRFYVKYKENKNYEYQIKETALSRILIIDDKYRLPEEIKNVTEKYRGKSDLELSLVLNRMNIDIVSDENDAITLLQNNCYTFILAHYSLLVEERKDKDRGNPIFYDLIKELKDEKTYFILFSGKGGIPPNYTDRFVAYSTIKNHLVEKPDKFKLIQVLTSLSLQEKKNETI